MNSNRESIFRTLVTMLFTTLTVLCNAQRDSLTIIPYDSLFSNLEPELTEISETEFRDFQKSESLNCRISSGNFISGYGLYIRDTCHESCESFLVDSATGKMFLLPSGYDQGIMGCEISPACTQLIVYSSYDTPDYAEYYSHRAEIYGFAISPGKGLETIKPSVKFYTQDWSIDEVIWVSETTIAIKVYEGTRAAAGNGVTYKYYVFGID